MMAWGDVLWAVTHCGASRPVKFADYRIHFSLEHMGGWARVALAVKEGRAGHLRTLRCGTSSR